MVCFCFAINYAITPTITGTQEYLDNELSYHLQKTASKSTKSNSDSYENAPPRVKTRQFRAVTVTSTKRLQQYRKKRKEKQMNVRSSPNSPNVGKRRKMNANPRNILKLLKSRSTHESSNAVKVKREKVKPKNVSSKLARMKSMPVEKRKSQIKNKFENEKRVQFSSDLEFKNSEIYRNTYEVSSNAFVVPNMYPSSAIEMHPIAIPNQNMHMMNPYLANQISPYITPPCNQPAFATPFQMMHPPFINTTTENQSPVLLTNEKSTFIIIHTI